MTNFISSFNNAHVKRLQLLIRSNQKRKKEGFFIIEGAKEIRAALLSGYQIESVFICPTLCKDNDLYKLIKELNQKISVFEITKPIYENIAYRESTEGVMAICAVKEHALEHLKLSKNPFVIVLEAVEKPGNLGAVLRTADACGADAVIVCDQVVDIYNTNVIRSSTGCVFYQQIATASSKETIKWLKNNNFQICAATPLSNKNYTDINLCPAVAIVLGSEAKGLTKIWFNKADMLVKIPMLGKTDSLNVSISAAVIAYEIVRQRFIKTSYTKPPSR